MSITYTQISSSIQNKMTATDGTFNYNVSYNFDNNGTINSISVNATKVSDNSYQGNMSMSENGAQNMNIASGVDLATQAANFDAICKKIKNDISKSLPTT